MTTGSVYLSVIQKERNLEYGGRCVHVVPDIPLEVISRIKKAGEKAKADVVIIEVGGTIGDYQNILFLDAVRMMKFENPDDVLLVLVSYVPALSIGGNELKTKPTQHAIHFLNTAGLHPDMVLARAAIPIDDKRKKKLEFMCGLAKGSVVSAPDVESIYEIPLNFEKDHLSDFIFKKLKLRQGSGDLKEWKNLARKIKSPAKGVAVAIVGKYFGTGDYILTDAYISVLEAIKHASYYHRAKPVIEWIDAEDYEKDPEKLKGLSAYSGIIVPGGFGSRGVEGKILAIKYAREHKIPYLGLCYGMQLAVVEYARHKTRLKDAHTTEINPDTPHPVIDILPEQKELMRQKKYGASMRLGAYPATLKKGTIAHGAYSASSDIRRPKSDIRISERHRHRFEVNPEYVERLEKAGIVFSGVSPDRKLMEVMELPKNVHPFFVGTQFHPELKSRPLTAHPLFLKFVEAALFRGRRNRS